MGTPFKTMHWSLPEQSSSISLQSISIAPGLIALFPSLQSNNAPQPVPIVALYPSASASVQEGVGTGSGAGSAVMSLS